MSKPSRTSIILAYAAIYLIWGATYLGIRFAVETLPPLFMGGLRFFAGGLLIFSWMTMRGPGLPRLSHWLPTAAVGVPLVTVTYGLLAWAQQTVPSGLAALFLSMIPMWMVVFDWARPRGIRPRWPVVAGIGIGIAGVGLLVNPTALQGSQGVTVGCAAMLVISAMSWSLGSIISRHVPQPASRIQSASMMMMSGGAILLVISLLAGEVLNLELGSITLKSWLALVYLVVAGSTGYLSYMWLLSISSAAKVATYAFVNPVVALLLGVLLADETLSIRTILSSMMIITSVMTIVLTKSRCESKEGDYTHSRSLCHTQLPQREQTV